MKSNITVEFKMHSVPFRATGYYRPARAAFISGPPENCYPEEPAEWEFHTLKAEVTTAEWVDAMWALETPLADALSQTAIDAIESQMIDDESFDDYDYDYDYDYRL